VRQGRGGATGGSGQRGQASAAACTGGRHRGLHPGAKPPGYKPHTLHGTFIASLLAGHGKGREGRRVIGSPRRPGCFPSGSSWTTEPGVGRTDHEPGRQCDRTRHSEIRGRHGDLGIKCPWARPAHPRPCRRPWLRRCPVVWWWGLRTATGAPRAGVYALTPITASFAGGRVGWRGAMRPGRGHVLRRNSSVGSPPRHRGARSRDPADITAGQRDQPGGGLRTGVAHPGSSVYPRPPRLRVETVDDQLSLRADRRTG